MQRYIAFLRAINVGGHIVKMDHLRTLFEALGFGSVETFIASGNVIFNSPSGDPRALEDQIEQRLKQALGYEVATFLRSPAQLAAIAAYQPFPDSGPIATGQALSIAFLKTAPAPESLQNLMDLRTEVDDLHAHEHEIYWLCRTLISKSRFSGALLEKTLGMPATIRNVTTVQKLAAKYAAPQFLRCG